MQNIISINILLRMAEGPGNFFWQQISKFLLDSQNFNVKFWKSGRHFEIGCQEKFSGPFWYSSRQHWSGIWCWLVKTRPFQASWEIWSTSAKYSPLIMLRAECVHIGWFFSPCFFFFLKKFLRLWLHFSQNIGGVVIFCVKIPRINNLRTAQKIKFLHLTKGFVRIRSQTSSPYAVESTLTENRSSEKDFRSDFRVRNAFIPQLSVRPVKITGCDVFTYFSLNSETSIFEPQYLFHNKRAIPSILGIDSFELQYTFRIPNAKAQIALAIPRPINRIENRQEMSSQLNRSGDHKGSKDLREIKLKKKKKTPSFCCWWHTFPKLY